MIPVKNCTSNVLHCLYLIYLCWMYIIRWFADLPNFEVWIFVIVYFQLLKTSLKLRKREFYWSTVFCLTNKKFLFSVKRKRKQILRNIHTSKFKIRQISGWHTYDISKPEYKFTYFNKQASFTRNTFHFHSDLKKRVSYLYSWLLS